MNIIIILGAKFSSNISFNYIQSIRSSGHNFGNPTCPISKFTFWNKFKNLEKDYLRKGYIDYTFFSVKTWEKPRRVILLIKCHQSASWGANQRKQLFEVAYEQNLPEKLKIIL